MENFNLESNDTTNLAEVIEKSEEKKPCPLCGTMLPYDEWLKVVGVYEEQQKYRKQLEIELKKAKEQSKKLTEEYKKIRQQEKEMRSKYAQMIKKEKEKSKEILEKYKEKERLLKTNLEQQFKLQLRKLQEKFGKEKQRILNQAKKEGIKLGTEKGKKIIEKLKNNIEKIKAERANIEAKLKQEFKKEQEKLKKKLDREKQIEIKRVLNEGIKKGIEKQKQRIERVSRMAERYRKQRDTLFERVKNLEEMLKRGTTPQIEGFDFERELYKQLKSKFPEDEINLTGKSGDIIQTIMAENKKVGTIIFECKKTQEFQNQFIEQIRRDKSKVFADFGVIVTWATKEDKQGFWVENDDIIIVHPYGVLDVATFLREILLQMYTLKISKSELEIKGKLLLEFMQSEEFRNRIQQSIDKSKEAYEIMQKEVKTHINSWKKRFNIYKSIFANTSIIQNTVRHVLLHGEKPKIIPEATQFPAFPLPLSIQKSEVSVQNETGGVL